MANEEREKALREKAESDLRGAAERLMAASALLKAFDGLQVEERVLRLRDGAQMVYENVPNPKMELHLAWKRADAAFVRACAAYVAAHDAVHGEP